MDVAQQFKVFGCEIVRGYPLQRSLPCLIAAQFDFINDDSTLFGMAQLTSEGSFVPTVTDDPPVGQWTDDVKLLNYELDEKWPWQCEAYEPVDQSLSETDQQASTPLNLL